MTLKTRLHAYYFNLSDPSDALQYKELCEQLQADKGRHFFNCLSDIRGEPLFAVGVHDIELETEHLFADQWNSTTARVFDWYEGIYPNRHIKHGHWLEITDEMREIRRTTLICGYCGKNYPQGHRREGSLAMFCDACLDSPYLKESDLRLLRLLPVGLRYPKRDPLTPREKANLTPRYVERQTTGKNSRAAQRRLQVREQTNSEYNKAIRVAKTKHDGMTWLLDRNVNIDNCIYYPHSDTFSFGWQTPVSAEVKAALLVILKDFPYTYEIVEADND